MTTKNVGTTERVLRVTLGGALAVWGVVLMLGGGSLIWLLVCIAVIALGLDFIVTGIRGYCPLYNLLGWSTTAHKAHA